jgi:transposase-like protein
MVWKCRGCNKLFNLFKLSSFSKWGSSTGGDDRPH